MKDPALTTRPTINCSITVVNDSAFDFRVSVRGSYVGTVRSGGDFAIPGLAYGEEAYVTLESNTALTTCGSFFIYCDVSLGSITSVMCVGDTFELLIVETVDSVYYPDMTCE